MSIDISSIQSQKKKEVLKSNGKASFFKKSFSFSNKLSDKKKSFIYKDLSTLLKAGVDFQSSLTIIRDQQQNDLAKSVIDVLLKDIVKGKGLHESMKATAQFTPYEIFSVKIGEETRKLDEILIELTKYFQRKVKLKKQIISILTYPAFILVLTFATLYFMLTYVVPLFKSVFSQFNRELPSLTKHVISLSENFNTIFVVLIVITALLFLFYRKIKNNDRFKRITTSILLKIPFFGKLIREIYLTRFCQSMALLLVSKTSLVESIDLVSKMINFYPIEQALVVVKNDIQKGTSLGESLSKFRIFDGNLVSMVKVAEQVNQLDSMFVNLANQYDDEVEHKTKTMGSIIEPMLILLIGGIVGVIMVSMYAPMFDLSEVIGGN